jgi:hypothetical protein
MLEAIKGTTTPFVLTKELTAVIWSTTSKAWSWVLSEKSQRPSARRSDSPKQERENKSKDIVAQILSRIPDADI